MTDEPTDIVTRLRIRWDAMGDMANDERAAAATEIERLRAQRDGARREACRWMAEAEGGTPVKHSAEMGWFCFGEKP